MSEAGNINSRKDFLHRGLGEMIRSIGRSIGEGFREVNIPGGAYYPIYENHTEGIAFEKEIPGDTTHFFKEHVVWTGEPYRDNVIQKITLDNFLNNFQNPELLDYLAGNGVELMLGDIVTPKSAAETELIVDRREDIGLLLLGISAGTLFTQKITNKYLKESGMTRRDFLKWMAIGAGGAGMWALSEKPFDAVKGGDFDKWKPRSGGADDSLEAMTPRERLVIRAYALQSLMHPEEAVYFFRNLVMAHKIMAFAEQNAAENPTKKIKISALVGGKHGGMEDMMRAGSEFCGKLMGLLYNDNFFRETVHINGGVEDFSKMRIVKLDPGGDREKATDFFFADGKLEAIAKKKISG